MPLYAGVFETDITPPHLVRMASLRGGSASSLAIHDPLYARALVLDDGSVRLALISCDLYALSTDGANGIRREIAAQIGTAREHVLIACSGNPHAPDTESEMADRPYVDVLQRKLWSAAVDAAHCLEPVHVTYGEASAQIGVACSGTEPDWHEPRPPDYSRAVAPHVQAICVNGADGRLMALLFGHACSADLAADCDTISAGWPGAACAHLKSRFMREAADSGVRPNALPLFLAGFGADVRPVRTDGWEAMAESGRQIGDAAHAARWNAHGRHTEVLAAGEAPIAPPTAEADSAAISWMRIGAVQLIAAPAPAVVALQLDIAAATAGQVLCVANANGSVRCLRDALAPPVKAGGPGVHDRTGEAETRRKALDAFRAAIARALGAGADTAC